MSKRNLPISFIPGITNYLGQVNTSGEDFGPDQMLGQATVLIWKVKTAKMQQEAGDLNAGLTDEERAAKIGLVAPLDAAYAAVHASDPEANCRCAGHFVTVGLGLNGDGSIDAREPLYRQLKVWQNLNQDDDNTGQVTPGPFVDAVQDKTSGVKELRSLANWGIAAINDSNGRYEFSSDASPNGVGYASVSTKTLEAEAEGTLYTLGARGHSRGRDQC